MYCIDLDRADRDSIISVLNGKLCDLEVVYKRNINSRPDYARLIADCLCNYLRIIRKIQPGYQFITDSESLDKILISDVL